MSNTFKYDCPKCNASLTGSEEDMGQLRECPVCQVETPVPVVRTGVNAKLHGNFIETPPRYPSSLLNRDVLAADVLVDNLKSLYRRKEKVGQDLDTLIQNVEVCRKQIELMKNPLDKRSASGGFAEAPAPRIDEKRSTLIGLSVASVTLLAAVVIMLMLFL